MEMKNCPKCKRLLPLTFFYKNGKYFSSWCKECQYELQRKRFKEGKVKVNKEKRNIWMKTFYMANKKNWYQFFVKTFGEFPICEVCGQSLKFMSGNKKNGTVQFDHKHSNSFIKEPPINWITKHKYNDKNEKIFLSCNFGILCGTCNGNLPTNKRKEWLLKALEYTEKE